MVVRSHCPTLPAIDNGNVIHEPRGKGGVDMHTDATRPLDEVIPFSRLAERGSHTSPLAEIDRIGGVAEA
nr:hypothetical protein CFP56_33457 [Quercus suber]